MPADVRAERARQRRSARRRPGGARPVRRRPRWALWLLAAALGLLVAVGVLLAGSEDRIPAGVSALGVKLSGLTPAQAEAKLQGRAAALADVPVVFTAAGKRFSIRPSRLDVRVDWMAAVAEARAAGDGPLPFRGLKRLRLRLFGLELAPDADLYEAGLNFELARIAGAINRPAREAALVLDGLRPRIVPAEAGRSLDVEAAKPIVLAALASFERAPVVLPVEVARPKVTAEMLQPVLADVRAVLSAPVRLAYEETSLGLRPDRLAAFLVLPSRGSTELRLGAPEADAYFAKLARAFARKPQNAAFAVAGDGSVGIVPGVDGRSLDIPGTKRAVLEAALRLQGRSAEFAVTIVEPDRTTDEARAMGIATTMAAYTTPYAGTEDRIHNLQLAVSRLDGTLVAPGDEFSLNETVGPRTIERGFRIAPVIIGGEYEEDVGGGVSQVATTIFNVAWEAGLKITERNPHALYIARYPDGRDATVNYPDLDLRFRNDTKRWILVEGSYDEEGITITLLGPKTGRRVVSEPGPLREVARPKLEKVLDPTLFKGQRVVEDKGEPARAIVVKRTVYKGDDVLYQEFWSTRYRQEPKIVRVGTKPKPKPKKPAEEGVVPAEAAPGAGATEPSATEPETTEPIPTTP